MAPFAMAFLFAVIVWAAPKARRYPDVWVAGAVLAAALSLVMLGNLRIINAIAGDSWTDAQANALGSARPGFDSGHSLAGIGMLVSVAAVVLLTIVLLARGVVRGRPALGAVVLSVLFPPYIIPGAGMFVLAGNVCLQRAHRLKDEAPR